MLSRRAVAIVAGGAVAVGLYLWRRQRQRRRDVHLLWLPAGQRYALDDLVFWKDKEAGVSFADAVARADTIVLGPHAGTAFPSELKPFVSKALTWEPLIVRS